MAKKKNTSSIGLGILDEIKEDLISEAVIEGKANKKKEARSKRSFMLNETVIKKLQFLKLVNPDMDLSTIVEASINLYFDTNKTKIDNAVNGYKDL